jgi:hypothetical protein
MFFQDLSNYLFPFSEGEIEKEYLDFLKEKSFCDLDFVLKKCGGMELALEGPVMLESFYRPLNSFSFRENYNVTQEHLARYSMTLDVIVNSMWRQLTDAQFGRGQIYPLAYLSSLYIHFSKSKYFSYIHTPTCLAIIVKTAEISDIKLALMLVKYWFSRLIYFCKNPDNFFWKENRNEMSSMIIAALHLIILNCSKSTESLLAGSENQNEYFKFKEFLFSFHGEGILETPSKSLELEAYRSISEKVKQIKFKEN